MGHAWFGFNEFVAHRCGWQTVRPHCTPDVSATPHTSPSPQTRYHSISISSYTKNSVVDARASQLPCSGGRVETGNGPGKSQKRVASVAPRAPCSTANALHTPGSPAAAPPQNNVAPAHAADTTMACTPPPADPPTLPSRPPPLRGARRESAIKCFNNDDSWWWCVTDCTQPHTGCAPTLLRAPREERGRCDVPRQGTQSQRHPPTHHPTRTLVR
jgi:hypothetical protein